MSSAKPTPPSNSRGHPSRRDNQSVSSTRSTASSSRSGAERSGSRSQTSPAVESAVTRLLVSIKQLLEALTLWSTLKMSETQVSDVYVRLGNDFNAAVAAFGSFNIDMSELMTVPDDLRNVLETCLAEDATPANLEVYLPTVRSIITGLLQGLRGKQSIYRRTVSDQRHRSTEGSGHDRPDSRSTRPERSSKVDSRVEEGSLGSPKMMRTISEDEQRSGDGEARKTRAASNVSREPSSQTSAPSFAASGEDRFVGSLPPPESRPGALRQGSVSSIERSSTPRSSASNRDSPPNNYTRTRTPAPNDDNQHQSPRTTTPGLPQSDREIPATPQSQVPPDVKRYSLVDRPLPPPLVVVDEASSPPSDGLRTPIINGRIDSSSPTNPPDTPPLDGLQAPVVASSLAALKKSDALERRASKRFSTYNISKMTGSSTLREKPGSANHPNRRSMAAGASLTPGELHVLTEADEGEDEPVASPRKRESSRSKRSSSSSSKRARVPSPLTEQETTPPVPPIPSTSPTPEPVAQSSDTRAIAPSKPSARPPDDTVSEPPTPATHVQVFLQVGREVKKVTVEQGLSFSAIRVLFVDKFSYSPGQDNFPAIYIRDPSSGIQYELEDPDEVKEKCLLSLNIEPLDQIKQHIDQQMSSLSQDIKDLRTMVTSARRISHTPSAPATLGQTQSDSAATVRPTDRQFQQLARRLSRFVANGTEPSSSEALQPQITGQTLQPQMTGGSVVSEVSGRIVADLKTQFDEVQNLRRDLGVMRQLYTDFMASTKESLGSLRAQTQTVRQLANAKVGGARAYIDSGKANLDTRSQNVLTRIEELQDTVENLKDDVTKRHITPKVHVFKRLKTDIDSVAAELESLKEHMKTIKPMWKKTWEEELQNIVEEQQFLSHQEEFLADLLEDHKALVEVYGHMEKVISIRGAGGGSSKVRGFRPPPPDEGHTGLSTVMMEIRGAAIDPERRMKAIEASQKSRERELAARPDEFQSELNGFVQGKKLKLTGGAEEVERIRQRRNDLALKAMFNNGNSSGVFPSSPTGESNPYFEGS